MKFFQLLALVAVFLFGAMVQVSPGQCANGVCPVTKATRPVASVQAVSPAVSQGSCSAPALAQARVRPILGAARVTERVAVGAARVTGRVAVGSARAVGKLAVGSVRFVGRVVSGLFRCS